MQYPLQIHLIILSTMQNCTYKLIVKKRVLTDEEKQYHKFKTPIEYTLKYFHCHRNFMPISEELGKLINRIKEIQKGVIENEKDI